MSHGPNHGDLGAATAAKLPAPYCRGPWKQWVLAVSVTAFLTLAITVEEHFRVGTPVIASAIAAPLNGAAAAILPSSPLLPVAATLPVLGGGVVPAQGAASEGLSARERAMSQRPRSPFNNAAESIRPAVVGVRAALTPSRPGLSSVERVGSGVIVDARGYAVTCNHVVAGASNIVVNCFREPHRQHAALVVAVEEDLALLKLQTDMSFEVAPLADSNQVLVGDWVLAVGHPFGLGLTVTSGIVGRRQSVLSIPGGPQYTELLQTDAPINEGSSGGPLVDLTGEVIGLNTAIYAPTGVFSGAGFAIPSNRVRQFVNRYMPNATGDARAITLPWGLNMASLDPTQLAQFPEGGVVVLGVEAGSPAALAQIAPGDVIVKVAAQSARDINAVRLLQQQLGAGASLQVQVWRQSRLHTLMLRTPNNRVPG